LVAVAVTAGTEHRQRQVADLVAVVVMEMERQQMAEMELDLGLRCRDMPVEKYRPEIMAVVAVVELVPLVLIGLMETRMQVAVEMDCSIQ
jgi:hypothetical protein